MSTLEKEREAELKARADEAAAQAKAETTDDDDDPDDETQTTDDGPGNPEDEAASTAPPVRSERDIERIGKELEKESERHGLAVSKIMGDDFEAWHSCPLCPTMVPGYVAIGVEIDPLQRQAVLMAMGDDPEPELQHHPDLETCTTCGGFGEVLTGGKSPTNAKRICPKCGGDGATTIIRAVQQQAVAPFPVSQAAQVTPNWTPMPEGAPPVPGAMWDFEKGVWTLPPSIPQGSAV